MGGVDLNIHLMMGDQANATQTVMEIGPLWAHVVHNMASAATLMPIAIVLDAQTSGSMVRAYL